MSSATRPDDGRYLRDGGASARAGSGFQPSFSVSEAKLHRPAPRPGMVHRARLVGRLMAEPRPSTISITAPPGYGKTVLLADWAAREERSTGWLTLDDLDNDPSVFVAYLAVAIDRISPIDPALMSAIAAPPDRLLAAAVPRLASELYRLERPALLILDDVHRLVDRACLDALGQLLEHLPPDVQVAMAGRTRPDLPFGRLRAHRDLLEIGRRQLAFDEVETRELTSAVGRHLTADQAARLAERTEGWAVAIYLATLADEVDGRQDHATDDVSGAEGHIADYLHSELSRGLADEDIALLTRTSILEAVEADAAGAVSALPDAPLRLRALARANLLIAEMGSPVGTYRYHRLLRDHLRAELERREPGVAPELHRRASSWYAAAGRTDLAIEHAFSSGDPDGTARLIEGAALSTYRGGHGDRVDRWMRGFDDAAFAHRPSLAVIGGWMHALDGRAEAAERMAAIVERSATGTLPADGSASFESARAMLRAAMAHRGPDDLLANATLATTAEGPGSPWRSTALMLLGWGHALLGDGERADAAFSDAVDAASTGDSDTYFPLAARASLAIGRGDWEAGERYVTDSHARMEAAHLEGVVPALLVHGVAARVAIHRGRRLAVARSSSMRSSSARWPPTPCRGPRSAASSRWRVRTSRSPTPRAPEARSRKPSASSAAAPTSGSSRRASVSCGGGSTNWSAPSVDRPRSRPRSFGCCPCSPHTSRSRRSESGCTCRDTPSTRSRSRSTRSSGSRAAARLSAAPSRSGCSSRSPDFG